MTPPGGFSDELLHQVAEAISRCRHEHDCGGFGEPTSEALAMTALEVALPLHYGREVTAPLAIETTEAA